LYIATGKGLLLYDEKTTVQIDTANIKWVSELQRGPNGLIWMRTNQGIGNLVGSVFIRHDVSDLLEGRNIRDLKIDGDGSMWFVEHHKGILHYVEGVLEQYGTDQGLTSNLVSNLFLDEESNLWVGTNGAGLNRLRKKNFFCY